MKKWIQLFLLIALVPLLGAWPWDSQEKQSRPAKKTDFGARRAPVSNSATSEKTAPQTTMATTPAARAIEKKKPAQASSKIMTVAPKPTEVPRVPELEQVKPVEATQVPKVAAASIALQKPPVPEAVVTATKSALRPQQVTPPIPSGIPAPKVTLPAVNKGNGALMAAVKTQQERQRQLDREMKSLQETLERAKMYNQVLSRMRSASPLPKPASAAVAGPERVRMLHTEAARIAQPKLAKVPAVPRNPEAERAIARARQAETLPLSAVNGASQAMATPSVQTADKG